MKDWQQKSCSNTSSCKTLLVKYLNLMATLEDIVWSGAVIHESYIWVILILKQMTKYDIKE